MKQKKKVTAAICLLGTALTVGLLSGCGAEENNGKTRIEIVQYKPEAVKAFEILEELKELL